MVFDYGIYYACAVSRLFPQTILFCLIAFTGLVGIIVYAFRKNIKYVIQGIVVLLGSVYLLTTNGLERHLLWLFLEGEESATLGTGFVECIVDEPGPQANFYDDESRYVGTYITIDGVRYLAIHANGLEVGQEVQMKYLPKSHIILRWDDVEIQEGRLLPG